MKSQNFQNLTDGQLVVHFQATGNTELFSEIYRRYNKKVYHTCLGIVKDTELAQDLAQDVMIKAMESLPKLQNGFLLGFWIHQIAKNLSVDHCKDLLKIQFSKKEKDFDLTDEMTDLEMLEIRDSIFDSLPQKMNELKEEDRTILTLRYFENHSIDDLQIKFGLSESAVKMRLSRARKRMVRLFPTNYKEALYA